ncbi:MAG TPA: hypothetical protein VFR09_02355 [Alphaproteobacteria bacterium]|nr:hypothetical protein [Alphaproteobacteria bacterium]
MTEELSANILEILKLLKTTIVKFSLHADMDKSNFFLSLKKGKKNTPQFLERILFGLETRALEVKLPPEEKAKLDKLMQAVRLDLADYVDLAKLNADFEKYKKDTDYHAGPQPDFMTSVGATFEPIAVELQRTRKHFPLLDGVQSEVKNPKASASKDPFRKSLGEIVRRIRDIESIDKFLPRIGCDRLWTAKEFAAFEAGDPSSNPHRVRFTVAKIIGSVQNKSHGYGPVKLPGSYVTLRRMMQSRRGLNF